MIEPWVFILFFTCLYTWALLHQHTYTHMHAQMHMHICMHTHRDTHSSERKEKEALPVQWTAQVIQKEDPGRSPGVCTVLSAFYGMVSTFFPEVSILDFTLIQSLSQLTLHYSSKLAKSNKSARLYVIKI